MGSKVQYCSCRYHSSIQNLNVWMSFFDLRLTPKHKWVYKKTEWTQKDSDKMMTWMKKCPGMSKASLLFEASVSKNGVLVKSIWYEIKRRLITHFYMMRIVMSILEFILSVHQFQIESKPIISLHNHGQSIWYLF